jgi:hypothetical protein
MDTSNKQINVKSILTSNIPIEETTVTVNIYETVTNTIRKLIGEYDINFPNVFITDPDDPQLMQLIIDKLEEI